MKSSKMKILAILLVAIFLISSAYAAVLCNYKGPDVSEHDLRLSDFWVSGDSTVNAGDKISVGFILNYVGEKSVTFDGNYGVFVAAKDPEGKTRIFGNTYPGKTLKSKDFVRIETDITLDKEGEWILWPSYGITAGGKKTERGPDEWHACTIKVEPKEAPPPTECPEGCDCLTEKEAKELGYEYCEDEKTLCGYDQSQIPMYCYQKPKEQDSDNDGIPDEQDNCPNVYNPQQEDSDNDGIGNECDTRDDRDSDGDGIKNYDDQCPNDAETFNGYMDDDGCPDEKPEEGPTMSIKKIPENPVLGDRVRYELSASDESGIAVIKIFMNGEKKRTCFASSCIYTTRPIEDEPVFGALAVNRNGFFRTVGYVPEGVRYDFGSVRGVVYGYYGDSDGDGIRNLLDNCMDVPNPDQSDIDNDGVGDACDECCPACGGLLLAVYCGFPYYGYSSDTCRDEISRYGREDGRDIYYWEDVYGSVSDNGCGCYDSDGPDLFVNGFVLEEHVVGGGGFRYDEMGRGIFSPSRSTCEQFDDRCVNSTHIKEYYCGPNGVESDIVKCPYDTCIRGRCTCPDTDGGWDYYNRGTVAGQTDNCIGSRSSFLVEHNCGLDSYGNFIADKRSVRCEYGCEDGACVCRDSDGGWDYEVRGRIGIYEDYCIDSQDPPPQTLVEYRAHSIRGDEGGTCEITNRTHTCDGLCQDGRCLPPSCDDGIMNQGEEDIDCGGPCDLPCDLCSASGLPDSFDWCDYKGRDWMTPVKHQGDCGSCWAFTAVAVVEAKYNIENTGIGEPIDRGAQLNLSEQQLVSGCYAGGYCSGGVASGALYEIREDGIPDEDCFPYEARTTDCRPCSDWESRAWTIDLRARAKRRTDDRDHLKRNIICQGPVTTCGDGHCVAIVGWNNSQGGWIIKNSWGEGWEGDGYGLIPWDHGWTNLDTQKYYVRGVRRM